MFSLLFFFWKEAYYIEISNGNSKTIWIGGSNTTSPLFRPMLRFAMSVCGCVCAWGRQSNSFRILMEEEKKKRGKYMRLTSRD